MGKAKVSDKKAIALKVKPGKKNDQKTKNKVTGFKITKNRKNDAETVELINQIKQATSKKNKAADVVEPKVEKQKKKKEKKASVSETPATTAETVTFENILPDGKTTALVQSLIDASKSEAEKKKNILGSNYKYKVQIQAIKIPKCPERIARILLPHSLLTPEDDVCLIVRDEQRGKKIDSEPTKQKWEDILKDNEIDCIKTVMPFNQLKNEYPAFEMKKKLVNSYELFLVDGSICGNTFQFMGQSFSKQKKNPIPLQLGKTLEKKSLKNCIEAALKKVQYRQTSSGDITTIDFANDSMTKTQIVENLEALIKEVKGQFPGGYDNIRAITLRPALQSSVTIPVYYNFKDSNSIEIPVIIGPKKQRLLATQELINDSLSKIQLVNSGKVVKKTAIEDAKQKIKTKLVTIVKNKKTPEEIKMQKKMKKIKQRGKKRELEKGQQEIRQKHETPFGSETVLLNKTIDSDNEVEEVVAKEVVVKPTKTVKNKKNIEKKTVVKAGKVTKKKIEKVVEVTKPVAAQKKVVEKKNIEKKSKLGKPDNKEAAKAGKIFKKSKLIKS